MKRALQRTGTVHIVKVYSSSNMFMSASLKRHMSAIGFFLFWSTESVSSQRRNIIFQIYIKKKVHNIQWRFNLWVMSCTSIGKKKHHLHITSVSHLQFIAINVWCDRVDSWAYCELGNLMRNACNECLAVVLLHTPAAWCSCAEALHARVQICIHYTGYCFSHTFSLLHRMFERKATSCMCVKTQFSEVRWSFCTTHDRVTHTVTTLPRYYSMLQRASLACACASMLESAMTKLHSFPP